MPPAGGWTLDALQALGAAQHDPLRWAYVQALTRRSAVQPAALRPLLQARLTQVMGDCAQRCAALGAVAPAHAAAPSASAAPAPSLLAGLLLQLGSALPNATIGAPGWAAKPRAADQAPAAQQDLKALQAFKRNWSRLSAEGQVARSAAQLPANPGPLNSQLLALRALQQMRALSPAYLQHFVAQVEALLWLDAATPTAALLPAKPARRDGLRKPRPTSGRG